MKTEEELELFLWLFWTCWYFVHNNDHAGYKVFEYTVIPLF